MSNEIAEYKGNHLVAADSMFFDMQRFEHAQRVARMLCKSTMVPQHFQGEQNLGNVMIALNYASRIGADVFMTMQNMCVIHGKPGLEGKLVISLVNNCGRFNPIQFKEVGNLREPKNDEDGCIAYATDLDSGTVLEGPKIDWAMVKAEGWYSKSGSKWKTMAPLMFRYRAATYFARVYCPEVLLGMQTKEEVLDVDGYVPMQRTESGVYESNVKSLEERLKADAEQETVEAEAVEVGVEEAPEEPASEPDELNIESATLDQIRAEIKRLNEADKDGLKAAKEACGYSGEWPTTKDALKKIVGQYRFEQEQAETVTP